MSESFKMKGDPMKRNFGIGASPVKQLKPEYHNRPSFFSAPKKAGTSRKIGPAESPEMIAKLNQERKDAKKKAEDSDKVDWDLEDKAHEKHEEYVRAKEYVK